MAMEAYCADGITAWVISLDGEPVNVDYGPAEIWEHITRDPLAFVLERML